MAGSDPIQTLRDLGERSGRVHLKDITAQGIRFDGWVLVERNRRQEDYEASARNMRQYLKEFSY